MSQPPFLPNDGDPMPTMEDHPLSQMASPDPEPTPQELSPPVSTPPSSRDALAEAVVENTRTTREMLDGLLRRQAQTSALASPVIPQDPGPMPTDGDPQALEHWMRVRDSRLRAEMRADIQRESSATNENVILSTMWNEICNDPDTGELARKNPDLFRMAFRDEGGRLPDGVDPQAFKQHIIGSVKGIVKRFTPATPASAPDPNPTAVASTPATPTAVQPNRTAGLSGPSAQVARGKAEVQDPNRGLLDDIREIQESGPYF